MQIMETRKEKHKPLDKCIQSVYYELAFELFFNNPVKTSQTIRLMWYTWLDYQVKMRQRRCD